MSSTSQQETPDNNAKSVITVEDLVMYYGNRKILNNVSMEVRNGEIMVIMGGSGSGKSTLLRQLMVLERPHSGTIKILDQDVGEMPAQELYNLRKKLGVAFQGGALFSSMSVGENIMLPLHEHTELDPATMQIMARMKLEMVNLAGFEDLKPSELSGGMIKRAAVARAIVMDPRILYMDEPSAGLDPVVSSSLDDLILLLRDAMGMTIVVVTHELESTFKIADRVTVLDQGEILFIGTVDELKNHPSERIQSLLNRRADDEMLDPDAYLKRLTGEDVNGDATL
jgi:phospholipid/cholesterol/gamma-HCH transport system ATP-binding protein